MALLSCLSASQPFVCKEIEETSDSNIAVALMLQKSILKMMFEIPFIFYFITQLGDSSLLWQLDKIITFWNNFNDIVALGWCWSCAIEWIVHKRLEWRSLFTSWLSENLWLCLNTIYFLFYYQNQLKHWISSLVGKSYRRVLRMALGWGWPWIIEWILHKRWNWRFGFTSWIIGNLYLCLKYKFYFH